MTHTKGPWVWHEEKKDSTDMGSIVGADGKQVCHFGDCTTYYPTEGDPPSEDDRARMLACVNALDGLDPAAVADVVAALEAVVSASTRRDNGTIDTIGFLSSLHATAKRARTALARIRGEG